jgi:hypothetical protein
MKMIKNIKDYWKNECIELKPYWWFWFIMGILFTCTMMIVASLFKVI